MSDPRGDNPEPTAVAVAPAPSASPTPPAAERPEVCAACGYRLQGIPSTRCPECGFDSDPSLPADIPWQRRGEIGRFRAFFETVRLAMYRPGVLGRQVCRAGVDVRSALAFRRAAAVISGFVPMVGVLFVWAVQLLAKNFGYPDGRFRGPADELGLHGWWVHAAFALFAIGVAALSYDLTGAGTWLFRLRRRSAELNARAYALGCYACAPLVGYTVFVAVIVTTAAAIAAVLWVVRPSTFRPPVADAAVLLYAVPLLAIMWLRPLMGLWATAAGAVLLRTTLRCGKRRMAAYAVASVASSLALAFWWLLAMPALVLYGAAVAVAIFSA